MSTDKITVQRAFNKLFMEFLDDIVNIYPDNADIKSAKSSFEYFKKLNPSLLIKSWYTYVYLPYADTISVGNLDYFFEKDYREDLTYVANNDEVLKMIENVRGPIRNMSDVNKEHTKTYLQHLNKLSNVYSQLG